jgi:hypothetical protein
MTHITHHTPTLFIQPTFTYLHICCRSADAAVRTPSNFTYLQICCRAAGAAARTPSNFTYLQICCRAAGAAVRTPSNFTYLQICCRAAGAAVRTPSNFTYLQICCRAAADAAVRAPSNFRTTPESLLSQTHTHFSSSRWGGLWTRMTVRAAFFHSHTCCHRISFVATATTRVR